jgi:hypothetical protein
VKVVAGAARVGGDKHRQRISVGQAMKNRSLIPTMTFPSEDPRYDPK